LKLDRSTGAYCAADPFGIACLVSSLESASAPWDGGVSVLFPPKVRSLGKIVVGMGLAIALGVRRQAMPRRKTLRKIAVLCIART
jgi:hypothetical protein